MKTLSAHLVDELNLVLKGK